MSANAPNVICTLPLPWWGRIHAALMPDYNRKATTYWWTMVLLGVIVLAHSLQSVAALPVAVLWQIVAGTVIAMLAGFFPVRIPRSKNSFAAGEIFIFLLLLLHGPGAARWPRRARRWWVRAARPSAGPAASPARRWRPWRCSAPARCCRRCSTSSAPTS